ncbi:MAG: multiheme c-type cytochrome, partial [Armatimonadetes bacterium]|nr:multiheme c-type cytochrome [Armatimonadota bacterium]
MKIFALHRRLQLPLLVGVLIVLTVILCVAGCTSPAPPKASPPPVESAFVTPLHNDFVGSGACVECHPNEVKTHTASRHANTLRSMSRKALAKMAPPDGTIPDTIYSIATKDGSIGLATQGQPEQGIYPMQLAFGSGKTGITFASVQGTTQLAEMRKSYFPNLRKWHFTPGQEGMKDKAMGRMYDGEFPRRCVLCHAVTVPTNTIVPEQKFMGVGCESCHGAGSAHINAIRTGNAGNLNMEPLKQATGERINEMCGQCHMTEKRVEEMNMPRDSTGRFQPYGLALSQCFKKSSGKLTCITCHNPHADVSTDTPKYEALCIQCHSASNKPASAAPPTKACPVNANSGCIKCHMPPQKIFKGTELPIYMPDHYIRIHR